MLYVKPMKYNRQDTLEKRENTSSLTTRTPDRCSLLRVAARRMNAAHWAQVHTLPTSRLSLGAILMHRTSDT